jgi:hypothetical protein
MVYYQTNDEEVWDFVKTLGHIRHWSPIGTGTPEGGTCVPEGRSGAAAGQVVVWRTEGRSR